MKNFSAAWKLLPHGKIPEIRQEIMDQCEWKTNETFYSKKRGFLKIRRPEWVVINSIMAKYNVNAETGEYIHTIPDLESAAIKIT